MSHNGLSEPMTVPVMIAKGKFAGPTLGLTSAIHGNELSGIKVIHKLFQRLDVTDLGGTIVAVPVLNPPGTHIWCSNDRKDQRSFQLRLSPQPEGIQRWSRPEPIVPWKAAWPGFDNVC
mmetsp:Transcript_2001/g.3670  ORF Transcript_2001/g.3670 Transcript_2001/m.3670 type:complete len:119 (-) Transcript_2001:890-1246(-)